MKKQPTWNPNPLSGQEIVILGGGESGVGAALCAAHAGWRPWVTDTGTLRSDRQALLARHGIETESGRGEHDVERVMRSGRDAGVVIKSPGIPETDPLVMALKAADVQVISEIELAQTQLKACTPVIAITGSNGKTTTTALTGRLFNDAGWATNIAGNIGKSWAATVSEPADVHVIEVSSFQLDGIVSFRPQIAILLNITPDHLDRYRGDFNAYAAAKWRITANQQPEDILILNAECEATWHTYKREGGTQARIAAVSTERTPAQIREGLAARGIQVWSVAGINEDQNAFTIEIPSQPLFTMTIQELALQGKHNLHNSMASSVAARVLDLRKEGIRESLQQFDGIEHRMEFVQEINGIRFINDSKATNVNSAWYALESVPGPVIWIAGGVDKGNDYKSLLHLVDEKVDHLICLGKDNAKLQSVFRDHTDHMHEVASAEDAVALAYQLGNPGTTVLLSPACASFDLFGSYEERGQAFKTAVKAL
ncbi:MAG: UDP-N-acetylmuramoyl-L-alanine--D-glutamate ligase [Flavobacteriales bacterium]